jgi:hypothetical protein
MKSAIKNQWEKICLYENFLLYTGNQIQSRISLKCHFRILLKGNECRAVSCILFSDVCTIHLIKIPKYKNKTDFQNASVTNLEIEIRGHIEFRNLYMDFTGIGGICRAKWPSYGVPGGAREQTLHLAARRRAGGPPKLVFPLGRAGGD